MNGNGKVVINLATGLEDAERVTVALPGRRRRTWDSWRTVSTTDPGEMV